MDKVRTLNIYKDLPETNPKTDFFGYSDFAKFVANKIVSHTSDSSMVISLNAPWGYGKTTCLNFIEYYLKKDIRFGKYKRILHFNPWAYSGDKDEIILHFMHVLGSFLYEIIDETETEKQKGQKLSWWKSKFRLVKKFFHYDKHDKNEFNALWKGLIGICSSKYVEEAEGVYNDLNIQKRQIEKLLNKTKKRIIVIIDDIDRLTKSDIRDVFKLMKAVADFNFITYIVSFDFSVVKSALDSDFCDSGEAYLEKIIQVPLNLPKVYSEDLSHLFNNELNKFIKMFDYEINRDIQNRYFVYDNYLFSKKIKSIRDIKRLFNSMIFNYSQIYTEVDLLDFIALEVVRLFESDLYKEFYEKIDYYVGTTRFISKEQIGEYFEKIRGKFGDKTYFISTLFPQTSQYFGYGSYGDGMQEVWNKQKRVCSKERANVYFSLRWGTGLFSDREILDMLGSINGEAFLYDYICSLGKKRTRSGRTKLFYWLKKITGFAKEIVDKNLDVFFISTIFKLRYLFNTIDDVDGLLVENDLRFLWLYNAIVDNIKDEERLFTILRKTINSLNDVSTIADVLKKYCESLGFIHTKNDIISVPITKTHYLSLEKLFIRKINNRKIHVCQDALSLLKFMRSRFEAKYNDTLKYYIEHEDLLLELLDKFYTYAESSTGGRFKIINVYLLTEYMGEERLLEKLKSIKNKKLQSKADIVIHDILEAKKFRDNK